MARKNHVTSNLETAPDNEPGITVTVTMWDYFAGQLLAGYIQRGDLVEDACTAASLGADVMMKARLERSKQRDNQASYAMETGNVAYNQDLTHEEPTKGNEKAAS